MKAKSKLYVCALSALLGLAMLMLGHSTFSQIMQEGVNARDLVPDEGQRAAPATPTPGQHDITRDDNTDLKSESEPEASKTIYDKSGAVQEEKPNAFTQEERGRINYGKRKETMVVKQSSKPARIEKTKDGSSDATVATGAFKDSLIDSGLSPRSTGTVMDHLFDPPDRSDSADEAHPAATPRGKARSKPAEESFGLTLGLAPDLSPTPSPHSSDQDKTPSR